ncbi:neuraminidase-like domain-containing protein [Pseudomonas sp. H9]|uniref:Tc toxin subunit A-related protein n=1 Tax=Pseudomonas sp. H9 TaxID=483968 RepID=UPI00140470B6|nr:neuraminidase-like domain-containing protein [Pseudomonas sp. H9]
MTTQEPTVTPNTYAKLFPEQLANTCGPEAPEANCGPIAYLHTLYQEALALETSSEAKDRWLLAQRRPDISELLLDPQRLEQPVSALSLAIGALTHHAQGHVGNAAYLPETLASVGKHANLPFHFALEQIKAVLKHRKLPYFELLQQAQYSYPNFCDARLRDDDLREVMLNASGLSPALQDLLLDHHAIADAKHDWPALYGLKIDAKVALAKLQDVATYCRQTGLSTEQVLELLAVSGIDDNAQAGFTAVRCSSAYRAEKNLGGLHYGAIYLNAGRSSALTVKDVTDEVGITLHFDALTQQSLVRMYQMIHLQKALALPFAEVDWLLISILRAQGQTSGWSITAETLRALGVFRYLNEAYGVSAEQFAALVYQVCPYSTGEQQPLLDRVLDGPGNDHDTSIETALAVDDQAFDPNDGATGQYTVLPGLANALGSNEQTTRLYLAQTQQALGLKALSLSLPVVSSLYRLSQIHRLLKRSPIEGIAMVALLGKAGTTLQKQLAGKPVVGSLSDPDMLDALVALTNLDRWLNQEKVSPTALLSALTEVADAKLAPDSLLVLAINQLLPAIREATRTHKPITQPEADLEPTQLDKLTAQLLLTAFGKGVKGFTLSQLHIAPLLRWCGFTAQALLDDVLKAATNEQSLKVEEQKLNSRQWFALERHIQLIKLLRLSPAAIQTLCDMPERFDLQGMIELDEASGSIKAANNPTANQTALVANLDLCYQLSRYRAWVEVCRANGQDEADATRYLAAHHDSNETSAVERAITDLTELTGWAKADVSETCPHIERTGEIDNPVARFDTFLAELTPEEAAVVRSRGHKRFILLYTLRFTGKWRYGNTSLQSAIVKLEKFIANNSGVLRVTRKQYTTMHAPAYWLEQQEKIKQADIEEGNTDYQHRGYFPIKFEVLPEDWNRATEWIPCVPATLTDIDYILRTHALCTHTGLACSNLQDLADLEKDSPYIEFQAVSQALLSSSDEALRSIVEQHMHEHWRDALAGYLIAHWAPAHAHTQGIATFDDLSSYCLTDIQVNAEVNTNTLNQAIGSLQHYLFRLFAHLEPGYAANPPTSDAIAHWNTYLAQYATWKQRQEQQNHPENLIHYANRPNKSVAFQELEVELNQGTLDVTLLHTAICNYLAKFERVSNLQVVSGYLEGTDPKQGIYHLIGKTNTTPTEYFWRTLDIGLRDDKQRLSPLAWSEWEKITLSPTGLIPQSYYKEKKDDKVDQTFTCDAVRPVIIHGRRYVFWVERGVTDLPSGDESNKTLPKMRKISVCYAFQQSDGVWSAANELMCLDGHDPQGKWRGDNDNPYLKDEKYHPGLIVVVDEEGERSQDPWLVAMLYDCAQITTGASDKDPKVKILAPEKLNNEYFIEARDLLLIDKQNLTNAHDLASRLLTTYRHVHCVQHTYNGPPLKIEFDSSHKGHEHFHIIEGSPYLNGNILTLKLTMNLKEISKEFGIDIDIDIDSTIFISPSILNPGDKKTEVREFTTISPAESQEFKISLKLSGLGGYQISFKALDEMNSLIDEINYNFKLLLQDKDEPWDILIVRDANQANQAQYLDLTSVANEEPALDTPEYRLNTLFGKNLVARASLGVEHVLAWATQCLDEPKIDPNRPNPKVDFHGANGLYFRELFLHLPALIATRLTEQRQFEDAEDWYLRYLFNPYRTRADEEGRPAPWCTRPLAEAGTLSSVLQKGVDPTSRVFVLSRYYQQAVYLALLENWRLQGDHYYREPTLSNLNHAWLCYQQAIKLLGPLPRKDEASRWQPTQLAKLDADQFRRPLNGRVIELRNLLESRLYNLRHGLTLDGKALPPLTWADESLDAFANTLGGVSLLPQPYARGRAPIPAYRFRQVLPLAKAAAQQLADFGRYYLRLIEEDSSVSESVMLKAHEIKLAEFTTRIQKEAINGLRARKSGMLISREAAKARHTYLSKLIDVGRSPEEEAATALTWLATSQLMGGIVLQQMGAMIDSTVPTIFGFAVGGNRLGAAVEAGGLATEILADISQSIAGELQVQAEYNRRAAEWEFDRSQVEWDIKVLDEEIKETAIELNAATIALAQCEQDRINLQEAYRMLAEDTPFYNWLVARQEQIYGAAYDVVRSLCLGVEEAWRYEIGDYQRESFIDTTAWFDNYKGMLAGESLLTNLQHMENQYMLANERRLTIRKAFSLKAHAGEQWSKVFTKPDQSKNSDQSKPLTHTFSFKAADFDSNYPGHYLRQLKYVSVTFVLKDGQKIDDLSAILTQTASTTLLEADKGAAKVLREGGKFEGVTSLLRNPRQNQQIALSSTVAEDGLGYEPGTWVYELMFHDGRYLPFEGTGAISEWKLEILGGAALEDPSIIKDITFNMVYTAKAGDSAFTQEIRNLS